MALLQPGDLFPNGTASIELLSGSSTKITPTSQSGNAYVFFETDLISNPNTTQYLQGATFTDLTQSVGGVVDGTGYRAGIVTHPGSSFTLNVAQDIPTGSVLIKSTGNVGLNVYNFPLDYYPGAAAAYSVRQLNTSYTGSAVEVSRDVDTQVQDIGFTANGSLDSTALLEFATNSSQSLLDYATGSAAAYSLRKVTSDSPVTTLPSNFGSGAAAAYSLRKVNANYTGSAIEVRRSSDDDTQDIGFDANGDLDTTALLDFVGNNLCSNPNEWANGGAGNGWQELGISTFTFVENVTDADGSTNATRITRTSEPYGSFRNLFNGSLTEGEQYTFSVYLRSTNSAQVKLDINDQESSTITLDSTWTLYTYTMTQDSTVNNFADFIINTSGGVVEVYNPMVNHGATALPFEDNASAGAGWGYVRTWYDQSGEGNDALNGTDTEQPLIVDGGTLVTENSKAAIKFDGVDDHYEISGVMGGSVNGMMISVHKTNDGTITFDSCQIADSNPVSIPIVGNNQVSMAHLTGARIIASTANNYYNRQLLVVRENNNGAHQLHIDGETVITSTNAISYTDILKIGRVKNGVSYSYFDNNLQEVIVYPSNQSSNRTDIEWEINNYYNIYSQWDRQSAIEVRRSSDDATQDIGFDANGDLDTTALLAFVNEDVNLFTSDYSSGGVAEPGGSTFTETINETKEGKTECLKAVWNGSSPPQIFKFNILPLEQGVTLDISAEFYLEGFTSVRMGPNSNFGPNNTIVNQWTTYSTTITVNGSSDDFTVYPLGGISGSTIWLKNIVVTQTTADGAVRTWYDQSGNHVTTSNGTDTEQPLIVDAGTVVTENGKAAINYNSSGYLIANFNSTLSQPNSIFSVCKKIDHSGYLFDGIAPGTARHAQGNSEWIYAGSVLGGAFPNADLGNQLIFTAFFNGASSEAFVDGSSTTTGDAGSHSLTGLTLGRYYDLGVSVTPLNGTMQEFILFDSDQSSNRLGIESNINAYYDIYTNPSASAYVRTWYDQSGNTKDAIQTAESARPKIVNTGSLVLENSKPAIDFDGVDDYLEFASGLFVSEHSIFTVVKQDNQAGAITAVSAGGGYYLRYTSASPSSLLWYVPDTTAGALSFLGASSSQNLITAIKGSANLYGYINGGNENTRPATGNLTTTPSAIGRYASSNYYGGYIQELIFFDSDQSENRTSIEAQINSFYKIYP